MAFLGHHFTYFWGPGTLYGLLVYAKSARQQKGSGFWAICLLNKEHRAVACLFLDISYRDRRFLQRAPSKGARAPLKGSEAPDGLMSCGRILHKDLSTAHDTTPL